jgi:PAS domain S-box-containing protein
MRWSAERAIAAGFSVALVILIVVGIVSYRNTLQLREATVFEQHTRDILDDLRELRATLIDIETSGRGYALTGDPSFLRPYRTAVPRARNVLDKLEKEVRSDENKRTVAELRGLVDLKIKTTEQQILDRELARRGSYLLPLLRESRDIMDRIREVIGRMQVREFELLQERSVAAENWQRQVSFILQIGSVSAVLFLAMAMYIIFKDLRERKRIEATLVQTTTLQNAILNGAGSSIIAADQNGIITSFNRAAESMLGYRAEQMIGKCSPIVIHDQDEIKARAEVLSAELGTHVEPGFEAFVAKARLGGVDQNEWSYIRKDGSRFPILLSVTALRDRFGIVSGYLGIATDITERKASQERLRQAEARFRALIQGSNDIVAMLAPSGAMLYVSPAVEEIIGYTPDEVSGKNVFDFIHPDDFAQAQESFTNTLSVPGMAVPLQLRLRGPLGEYRWVEILANNLIHDPDLRAVVINARDISERRELERRSALQSSVTAVLADSQSLPDAMSRILAAIGEQMDYDLGEVWRVDKELGNLALVEHWHSSAISDTNANEFSVGFRLGLGEGLPGTVWKLADAVLLPDLNNAGSFLRTAKSLKMGLSTGFGVPIPFGDQIIAVINFASRRTAVPDPEMLRIFRSLASQIGNFMGRKRAEESAERLRRQTQLILESAGEGIIGIDLRYRITFVNAAAERMLGYRSSELVGRDVFQSLHPTRADGTPLPQNETPIFAALVEGSLRTLAEGTFWRKDGTSFPVQYIGAPIRGDNAIAGAVLTFQDVTQRREIERMKNEFISVVSHELRTPLTSIRGALGLLAGGKVGTFPDKAQRMLDIAVSNTDRLVRLINDILDIERIDSGRAAMQKREVRIGELMSQAVDVMRAMSEKNDVLLEVHPLEAKVNVDPDRIIQTLTNLISNAIKFSPPGGKVTLSATADSETLHLKVADQGRGIPQEMLESIFERFHQVDATDSREKGGTGLGLAICRTIIQQHGGKIWAESIPGQGSNFFIDLPLVETPVPVNTSDDHQGASVLVCDDDPAVCEVVGNLLEARGFRVMTVGTGPEAIQLAEREHPDLIVLDLVMPSMNGWQVTDALKGNAATKDIPVVIFSVLRPGESPNGDHSKKDIAGWVTKPLEESQFFKALSDALRGRPGKTRVLVVEDDPDLSRVLKYMLQRDGVEATVARSGREAIQMLMQSKPDLLVLDLILPLGDGFTVVQWLRQSPEHKDLPVMVYSGRDLTQDEKSRLTVGRTEFFTKGRVAPDDFEQHVLTLLTQMLPARTAGRG